MVLTIENIFVSTADLLKIILEILGYLTLESSKSFICRGHLLLERKIKRGFGNN